MERYKMISPNDAARPPERPGGLHNSRPTPAGKNNIVNNLLKKFSLLAIATIGIFSATTAHAATRVVGPGNFATVTAAIAAASSGDTISVTAGTYTETNLDTAGKSLTIQSVSGAASTILELNGSAGNLRKGFYAHSGETVSIQGFTIQNGYDTTFASGIVILGSTATISNCVVKNCTGRSGGGIEIACSASSPFTAANATVTGCTIKNCAAFQGGGIFLNASNATFHQCDFLSNASSSSTSPTTSYGGGLEITKNNSNVTTVNVTDCVFISNSSGAGEGAAIDIASNNANQTTKVYNCSFYGNSCTTANNGTIDFFNGTNSVRNCIFWGDTSPKEISTASPPAAGVVQFCDVNQTGYAGVNNNISSDPLYVAPGSQNLHIASNSPAARAGTSSGAPTVDHDGATWSTNISMGAFDAAAVANHFSVSAPSNATSGTAFNVTVTAKDSSNATVTGYTGTVHFTTSDGSAITVPANSTLTSGTGTFSFTLATAGTQTVTATDTVSGITGTSGNISVGPGAATRFSMTVPVNATAGTAFNNLTVVAKDAQGNTATGYSGTVHFTSTDGAASLPANTTLSSGSGTFSATLRTAGNQTITATDTVSGSVNGTSGLISVSAGAATHFSVSAPGTAMAGSAFNYTVTALDASNNTATGYSGTVHFTSTDGSATLPSNSTLSSGVGTFSATLKTAGSQTITATDTVSGSITGTSGNISVGAAAAASLTVSAPGSATAGSSFNFTVTAKDAFSNTATGYSGTVHFTSTDGAAALPANSTLTSGVGTFSATLNTVGSRTITATDTVSSSINGTSGTINVSAGAATHYSVSAPGSATAGSAFNVTVTALDAFNNTATGYSGTVHFTSTDGAASLPANSTLTSGTGTFSATLNTAGSRTITATDTVSSSITGTSNSINVSAGAATHFSVSAPGTATAGSAFNYTVTALDASNNTATGYSGTVHFTSNDGAASLPSNSTLSSGTGTFSATLNTAGNRTITATDTVSGSITGTSGTISVAAGAATHYSVSAPSSATAGSAFNVTVTALDASNNTVIGYNGTVHFTSSDGAANLPANSTLTGGTGTFSATLKTAGTQTITATDTILGSITGTSGNINVGAGAAASLTVSAPGSATAGSAFNFTVTAKDAFGNTATGYAGTVHFTSTDAGATLPADATLTNGSGSFTATLIHAGSQTITVTDTVNSGLTATTGAITVTGLPASQFLLTAPASSVAGTSVSVSVQATDQFGNPDASYSGTVHFTSTDPAATLPLDSAITGGSGAFFATFLTAAPETIRARDTTNTSITGTTNITVTADASTHLTITASSDTSAGIPFYAVVTAKDQFNNTVTGYTGTIHLTSTDGLAILPADFVLTGGSRQVSVKLRTPGTQTVTATDTANSSLTATTGSINVVAAPAKLVITGVAPTTAGSPLTFTVTAKDSVGNIVTNYTGTVHITSTDGQAVLPADATLTNGVGTFTITFKTAATQVITATDAAISTIKGTSAGIVVSAAAATQITLTAPASTPSGAAFQSQVTAVDAYGNTAKSYTGTVHFTSTDGQAVLPANVTLPNGTRQVTIKLKTTGSQTFTATDTVNSGLAGTSGSVTVN